MSGCWTQLPLNVVQAEQFHSEEIEQGPEIYVVLSQSFLGRLVRIYYQPLFAKGSHTTPPQEQGFRFSAEARRFIR